MIIELLLTPLFTLLDGFLALLPSVSLVLEGATWLETVKDLIKVVVYFLPMSVLIFVFDAVVLLTIFKSVISLIQTVWGLIPFA